MRRPPTGDPIVDRAFGVEPFNVCAATEPCSVPRARLIAILFGLAAITPRHLGDPYVATLYGALLGYLLSR